MKILAYYIDLNDIEITNTTKYPYPIKIEERENPCYRYPNVYYF